MFFDLWYWVVLGIGAMLSFWASSMTRAAFSRYSRVGTRSSLTGAQVAERILRDNGIYDVRVEGVAGRLTDHYDPRSKTLRLSEPVYGGRSLAAFGVAAHEVGHAIQHAQSYGPLKFRSAWVPVANTGGSLSLLVIILALFMGGLQAGGLGALLSYAGLLMFATTTIFTLVTLPVEFDASRRALVTLEQGNYLTSDELPGARKVLNAAGMTYVAAFLASLLQLLYWAALLMGSRNE